MKQGLYLFCLARKSRLPVLPLESLGLDGQTPVQVTGFRDLAAVWAEVNLGDFCGPEAAEHLQNLAWIGPRVIRHQEVVAGIMQHSPVMPARFGTIFLTVANLQKVLHEKYDAIAGSLEHLSDREEWAVKGLLSQAAAKEKLFSSQLAQRQADLEGMPPGKRYFAEQQLKVSSERELSSWLKMVHQELWDELKNLAAESRERRLLSREASGRDRDMVFNWAFLLSTAAVAVFKEHIQAANHRYDGHGLQLECTGPWPPYSFCPAVEPEPEA